MDIKTWIDGKAEECGYRPHTPEETKKLLHALLAEIEKAVEKEERFCLCSPLLKEECDLERGFSYMKRRALSILRPSEPKGEEKP